MAAMELGSRTLRKVEDELADLHGDLLAARAGSAPGAVVDAHFDNRDGGFLQRCARRFTLARPAGIVFLTASRDGAALFVVAAGAERVPQLGDLGAKVAGILEGRGGGAGGLFQGKAQSLARRESAVMAIRRME
jgi:alanyl-tRNA synthetase